MDEKPGWQAGLLVCLGIFSMQENDCQTTSKNEESKSTRARLEQILTKLRKLLPLLASDKDGEANNARLAINRLLQSANLDWHDVASLLMGDHDAFFDSFFRLLEKDHDVLIRIARAETNVFVSGDGLPYTDVMFGGNRVTWPVERGGTFEHWLIRRFFTERKTVPSTSSLKTALHALASFAEFDGDRYPVGLRIAECDGKIYFDLADKDQTTVEIDGSGWRFVKDNPPVRFRRNAMMAALPKPQDCESLDELRQFVNLNDRDFVLYTTWLCDAFCPGRPHPVLCLCGEAGSGKTSAATIARSLIDPVKTNTKSAPQTTTLPRTTRDLFVAASNGQVLAFDNLSQLSANISDALCMISTGGGYTKRRGFTDTGQIHITGSRPIILAGTSNTITRSDLADRAIILQPLPIDPTKRRTDVDLQREFEAIRPKILGALLTCLSSCLRRLPTVLPDSLPRMARLFQAGNSV